MKKGKIISLPVIIVSVIIVAVSAVIFILPKSTPQEINSTVSNANPNPSIPEEQKIINDESQTSIPVNDTSKINTAVPPPLETDIIRSFFQIIGEHRAADAVGMMDANVVGDDSSKQAWAVQFNAFESLEINSVEPSMPEEWSSDRHTYKVTISANMKPESANAPMPFYGWENGTNIRWVTIVKNGDLWKISGIATGP